MRRVFLVLAVIALLTVAAMPAMADDRWGHHDDCGWWGCDRNDCDWRGCDREQPFFNPFFNPFFTNDCEWEFVEGWFWGFWGWQWGTWVLDC